MPDPNIKCDGAARASAKTAAGTGLRRAVEGPFSPAPRHRLGRLGGGVAPPLAARRPKARAPPALWPFEFPPTPSPPSGARSPAHPLRRVARRSQAAGRATPAAAARLSGPRVVAARFWPPICASLLLWRPSPRKARGRAKTRTRPRLKALLQRRFRVGPLTRNCRPRGSCAVLARLAGPPSPSRSSRRDRPAGWRAIPPVLGGPFAAARVRGGSLPRERHTGQRRQRSTKFLSLLRRAAEVPKKVASFKQRFRAALVPCCAVRQLGFARVVLGLSLLFWCVFTHFQEVSP